MIQLLLASGMVALITSLVVYQIYKARWLACHGRQIIAMVTSIRREGGRSVWGYSRDNYYVTAAWTNPRTGRRYTFWTWIMGSSPAYTLGSLIPVLIDPRNPGRYCLDLQG
jgi:hypothetical protein